MVDDFWFMFRKYHSFFLFKIATPQFLLLLVEWWSCFSTLIRKSQSVIIDWAGESALPCRPTVLTFCFLTDMMKWNKYCQEIWLSNFQDVLNTFCWIHSTYTIPSAFWKRIGHDNLENDFIKDDYDAGIDVAHPGIDKTIDPEERRYVRYYQWVCFCLFFQVIDE